MKTTLLAVCGLSPQVLTETLYALDQQGTRVDSIRVLTTRLGKDACIAGLFGAGDGQYIRYLNDYRKDSAGIDFAPLHVKAVRGRDNMDLEDIAGDEDNEAFLKACLETAFNLTADRDSRVLFSIAGGRKTMGACLTLAAQFYGRPWDRVYHVLVSPEFESNRDFYFPPAEPQSIQLRDRAGQPYFKSSQYAKISLVPMPFISVRERITDEYMKKPEPPGALLLSIIKDPSPELSIDCRQGTITYKGVEMDMMPARLALYTFFALRKKESPCGRDFCRGCRECFLTMENILNAQDEIASIYRALNISRSQGPMSDTGIMSLSAENFSSYKSRIRRDLERFFGPYETDFLEIASEGKRPDTRYGLLWERSRLKVIL